MSGRRLVRGTRNYSPSKPIERLETRRLLAVNPAVIDLLVPYTAAAVQGAGGQTAIVNKINRAVADLNQTLANSEVNASIRLVGTMQTSFTEDPTGVTADLTDLPTIPDIAAMKTQLGADLVDMWVGPASNTMRPADAEGIAGEPDSLNQAEPSSGYAVQWWGDSNANLTVHEIGHMLGGGHVHGQDPNPHTIPNAYDYSFTQNGTTYGTAIDDFDAQMLIPYYSNPNVFWRGTPVGAADNSANPADNASVMNQIAPLIAGYSPTMVPDTTPPIAGLDQVQGVNGQNNLKFDVTYYDGSGVDVTSLGNSNILVTGPNGFTGNATFTGTVIDGNLTPVSATTVNQSVVQAVYTISTPATPGDLAGYNFAVNANQVKDIAGNYMPAAALPIASGANPNNPNPQILPRYGGDDAAHAVEAGDLSGGSWKLTDFVGPYYLKEGSNWGDDDLYHFSMSTASTITVSTTGPVTFTIDNDTANNGMLGNDAVTTTSPGIYKLAAGQNYYLDVSPLWNGNGFGTGTVFTAEITAAGAAGLPATSSLSGNVFQDTNLDGNQQAGEPGIPSVMLTLTGTDFNGNPVAMNTTTDANGNFTFSNVVPSGTAGYVITIPQNDGYTLSTQTPGTGGGAGGGTAPDAAFTGVTVAGATTGYIFAEAPKPAPVTFSGEVFNDTNANSTLDAGEPGIAGVSVTLTGTNSAGIVVNMTTATAADGTFTFTNVPPTTDATGAALGAGYTLTTGPAVGFNSEAALPGTGATNPNTLGVTSNATTIQKIYYQPGNTGTGYNFARTLAPATQAPPVAVPAATTVAQGGTFTGNVLNAAVLGTVTTPTTTTTGLLTAADLDAATVSAAASKSSKLSKKQALMYAVVETMPKHALHFSLNANGTFSYTPLPGFYGTDTFEYNCVMTASGLCANTGAPFTIKVKRVDQAPVAGNEVFPTVRTAQGTPVEFNLNSFVTEPQGKQSSLHFLLEKSSEGILKLISRDVASFIPNPTFSGTIQIHLRASDGIKTSGVISLNVIVQPIGVSLSAPNETVSVVRHKPILINLLSKAIDTTAKAKLTASIVTAPTNGTARIIDHKLLLYTAAAGTQSSDSLVYEVTDQFGHSATETITLSIG